MSTKANPTLVGAFILTALCLALIAIVILGSIQLKDNRLHCVAFFTGSLYGLDVGAPVTFRGVTIGRVSAVRINFDRQNNDYLIPVYVDIEHNPDRTTDRTDTNKASQDPLEIRSMLQQSIDKGLRAQLKTTSLLTGKLYIELAFFQNAQLPPLHNTDEALFEIPTQPSGLEQITQKLESLPLTEILEKTASALDGINTLIHSKETQHALTSLNATLDRLNSLITSADAAFPTVASDLKKGLANFATLSATANTLLRTADKELPALSTELKHLLTGLHSTAETLTKTLQNVEKITSKDSLFAYQVTTSLREIERAAASIRQLTDYLQQTPNALIFGPAKETP